LHLLLPWRTLYALGRWLVERVRESELLLPLGGSNVEGLLHLLLLLHLWLLLHLLLLL